MKLTYIDCIQFGNCNEKHNTDKYEQTHRFERAVCVMRASRFWYVQSKNESLCGRVTFIASVLQHKANKG